MVYGLGGMSLRHQSDIVGMLIKKNRPEKSTAVKH